MAICLSPIDLDTLRREADRAAARLVRQFRLPPSDRDDLRQDLLVDLIARLKSFIPARGSLGAFAGKVVAHQATRLAAGIVRDRAVFAPVSLDDQLPETDGATVGETIAENEGYLAAMGQPTDGFGAVDRRLDLDRALGTLSPIDLTLCAALTQRTPTELSQDGQGARASLYRQVRDIRLQLLTAGFAAA